MATDYLVGQGNNPVAGGDGKIIHHRRLRSGCPEGGGGNILIGNTTQLSGVVSVTGSKAGEYPVTFSFPPITALDPFHGPTS